MNNLLFLLGLLALAAAVLTGLEFFTGGEVIMAFASAGALGGAISLFAFASIIDLLRQIRDNTKRD